MPTIVEQVAELRAGGAADEEIVPILVRDGRDAGAVRRVLNGDAGDAVERTTSPWTAMEDERLRELVDRGFTAPEIAQTLGRSEGSVRGRCGRIGLLIARKPHGSKNADESLAAELRSVAMIERRARLFHTARDKTAAEIRAALPDESPRWIEDGLQEACRSLCGHPPLLRRDKGGVYRVVRDKDMTRGERTEGKKQPPYRCKAKVET